MDQLIAGFIKHQQSILDGDKSEEVMAKQKYCTESLLKERKKPLDECQEQLVALRGGPFDYLGGAWFFFKKNCLSLIIAEKKCLLLTLSGKKKFVLKFCKNILLLKQYLEKK